MPDSHVPGSGPAMIAGADALSNDTEGRLLGTGCGAAVGSALRTARIESKALDQLQDALSGKPLGVGFEQAVALISSLRGRLVVSGMGKSGLVGRKIAATLASTGTPALFLHPADASHGDLGMVTPDDIALVLSWSGETSELHDLLHYCRRFGVPVIALTACEDSTLARVATICLIAPEVQEACPNGLAPTSSTTLQIVLGDALAVALLERRGFSTGDFHLFHPKGRLGARLLTVGGLMSTGQQVPQVSGQATILEAALEMTEKRLGATAVVDDGQLVGSFTDGDLRRSLAQGSSTSPVRDHMSRQPYTVEPALLASDALALMNRRQISQLFVCDGGTLVGMIHMHDVVRAGVV